MTNDQMKVGRFLRWHKARQRLAWIQARLAEGYTVQTSTYLRSVRYKAKHADMFKATKAGLFVQRGKNWDCIDFCKIEAF
jgi:hypothetical protein